MEETKTTFEQYLINQKLSPNTIGRYIKLKTQFEKFAQGNLAQYNNDWVLGRLKLLSFIELHKNTGLVRSTIKKYISYMKNQNKINGLTKEELLEAIPILKGRKTRLPKYLTHDEIQQLMNHSKTPFVVRVSIRLMYENGLRVSEAVNLKKKNVNFNRSEIRFIGKGDKEAIMMITETLKNELAQLCEHIASEELIFRKIGNVKFNRNTLWKEIRSLGKLILNNGEVHPHMFRHSLATEMLEQGSNLSKIQKILRHEKIATTSIYAHVKDKDVEEDWRKVVDR